MKKQYFEDCLKPVLGDHIDDEIIEYLLKIKNHEDFEDFMCNIIDKENSEHIRSYTKIKESLFNDCKPLIKDNKKVFRAEEYIKASKAQQEIASKVDNDREHASSSGTPKGRKSKYTKFDLQKNTAVLKTGRFPCNCEAKKHALINNCTKCGRIVCEQEGSGSCFFCGSMVCTKEEMELLSANTKQSDKLYNMLMERRTSKEWKKAVENKERLLLIDKQGSLQNEIIDDQTDYFDVNDYSSSDLDAQTRGKKEKRHKSRSDTKLLLDFATRSVKVSQDEFEKYKKNHLVSVSKLLEKNNELFPKTATSEYFAVQIKEMIDSLEECKRDKEEEQRRRLDKQRKSIGQDDDCSTFKIANEQLLSCVDQGMCLSMHQPWASLLIAGIKYHEGRTWPTNHRGRLWIHAASKQPTDDEILGVEKMYRDLYNDSNLVFPRIYPTSCLLGCVELEDCLPQKTYKELYPDGESDSPFVFICSSPAVLPVFFPMQGEHKIFQLNKSMLKNAKAALSSQATKWVQQV